MRCVYKIYQAQVTTEAATDIKAYQANLNGNVVFAGYDQNFTRGFVYGTDMNNLIFDTAQRHQSAEGQYFFKIENLEPNTTYYYKSYVVNEFDTAYGAMRSFTTLPIFDTIALLPNGGIGTPDTMRVERGVETTLHDNTFTHGGNWQFLAWNTDVSGSGTQYADQATITTNGNLTLYAQWRTWCEGTPQANELGTSRIDSVKDHQNNWYNVVQIGNQCWMKENMRAITEPNGGTIVLNADSTSNTTPMAYSSNVAKYGYLYNFAAAMNIDDDATDFSYPHRGICPEGWHIPSSEEWTILTAEAGVGINEGTGAGKLVGGNNWNAANYSTASYPGSYGYAKRDSTGFSALPAGYGDENGVKEVGYEAGFWSSTPNENTGAYRWSLYIYEYIDKKTDGRSYGHSVRCVRDEETHTAMSVTTDSANLVATIEARLHGNVTNMGGRTSVKVGFKYGTSESALTSIVADESEIIGTGRFYNNITGLTANTTYYFKAFVANSTDTVYGEVKNFTTAADIVTDTIAFVPNGGQGAMDTMFVTRGNTALNANTYTHDGNWEFLGWNTEADGAGTHYDNQAALTTNGNVTLYAQWGTWCTGIPRANESGTSRIDSVKDIDNNKYNVVQIGNQCWMKQNLRTTTNTANTGNIYTPETAGYNVNTYGLLYDWAAVMQGESSTNYPAAGQMKVQGICPDGWHVPSDAEWDTLTYYVYNSTNPDYKCSGCGSDSWESSTKCIAKALSSTTGWNNYNNDCAVGNLLSRNNATGFSALPAGGIYFSNEQPKHNFFSQMASFSSATDVAANSFYTRTLQYSLSKVGFNSNTKKELGLSVRCLRDAEAPAAMSVTTDSATTVTKDGATLYGIVTSLGGNDEVTAGFRYGQHPDYMTFKTESTVSATGSYNAELTNISPNTTYYFQAYAATATDTAWAADTLTFTTLTNPCSVVSLRAGTALDGGKFANKEYGSDRKMDSVSDHEGNVYRVVEIGRQCWMAENMRATTSPRQEIVNLQEGTELTYYNPKYYKPSDDTQFTLRERGYLYNWVAAMDTMYTTHTQPQAVNFPGRRGICPEGWHLPTDDEWFVLEKNVLTDFDYSDAAASGTDYRGAGAGQLTGGHQWSGNGNSTTPNSYSYADRNSTGFSALPVGYYTGNFTDVGLRTAFHSATSYNDNNAWIRHLYYTKEGMSRANGYKDYGRSVRCVRD